MEPFGSIASQHQGQLGSSQQARRTTMLRFAHRQQRASFRRAGLALALAASVAAAVLPAAPLARADHESGHVPVARVQVQLKRIHILDDRDGWGKGKGELHFTFFVLHFSCPNNAQHLCQEWTRNFEFSANSGDVREIHAIIPDQPPGTDDVGGGYRDTRTGIALYPGDSLLVSSFGRENDPIWDDALSQILHTYTEADNWGIGSHAFTDPNNDYRIEYDIIGLPLSPAAPSKPAMGAGGAKAKPADTALPSSKLGKGADDSGTNAADRRPARPASPTLTPAPAATVGTSSTARAR